MDIYSSLAFKPKETYSFSVNFELTAQSFKPEVKCSRFLSFACIGSISMVCT